MFLRADVCCVVIHVTIFLKLSSLPCQRTHCFIHNLAMIFYSNKTHQWPLPTVWAKQGSKNLELWLSKTKREASCALLALDKRPQAHTSAHSVATGEIPRLFIALNKWWCLYGGSVVKLSKCHLVLNHCWSQDTRLNSQILILLNNFIFMALYITETYI